MSFFTEPMTDFEIAPLPAGSTGRRSPLRRRLFGLLPVLLSATLLPGCSNDTTPSNPSALRSIITVTITPSPVPGSQNALTGAVTAAYKITVSERQGLGGELVFVNSTVFDPQSGVQVGANYWDGDDLVVFVGTKRVEGGGSLEIPQTLSYILPDLRREATLTVAVQFKDDRGNTINVSQLVNVV